MLGIGLLISSVTAEAATSFSDTTEVFSSQPLLLKTRIDTLPVQVPPVPVFQNVFHQRLYSIQKEVPLTYNAVVQDFIDIYLKRKDEMGRMVGRSEYYFPIFEKALRSKGIPEEVKFLAIVESALDPQAVSRVGATGPWQFMFSSAKAFGLTIDDYQDERMDPIAASYAAANYFRDAYNEFGDWLLALAAYNCGKGNVNRAIRLAGGVNDFWAIREYLPKETRNYVPAFIATTYVMNYYKNHGIARKTAELPLYTDTVGVNKYVSLSSVSKATGLKLNDLLDLNPSYTRRIVNGSPDSPKRLIIPRIDRTSYHSLYNALNLIKEDPAWKGLNAGSTRPSAHQVKAGETLDSIAGYYQVDAGDLRAWNRLTGDSLRPGQTLKLSGARTFITYKVQPGDTLSSIASKFRGANEAEIRETNELSGDTLTPGTVLRISQG